MAHTDQDRFKQLAYVPGFWGLIRHCSRLPRVASAQGLLPLLLSTALAEIAGSVVYFALLESA